MTFKRALSGIVSLYSLSILGIIVITPALVGYGGISEGFPTWIAPLCLVLFSISSAILFEDIGKVGERNRALREDHIDIESEVHERDEPLQNEAEHSDDTSGSPTFTPLERDLLTAIYEQYEANGRVLFGRWVDHGPVAGILNRNKQYLHITKNNPTEEIKPLGDKI